MARLLPLLLLAVALGFAVLADGPRAWGSGAGDDASPLQLPAEGGDVLVFLREPPALAATPLDRSALRAQVSQAQERVLGGLAPADFQVRYRYQALPALAGTVSAQGLKRLAADPDVAAVWPDLRGQGALGQSVPLINANAVQSMGYSGAGSVVAVIDSGIDTDHPDLAGDLIHEECFMAGAGLSSRCPNGTTRQSGPGAAEDDHGHGTNVAGIITGAGTVAPKGVAPAAGIEAFKIIDKTNSLVFSDLTAALDHILASHPDVDIINMSLGTFFGFPPGTCEGGSEPYNTLRAAGVILFAASMNEGSKAGTGYPACVKSVVSVGAVYDANIGSYAGFACTDTTTSADKVACWSNSDSSLDLLGPGCRITASGRFGGSSTYCGTSQATPHAAGVAALLVGADPTYTPDRLESALKSTGVLITDPANDVTTPRLDALAAISLDSDGDGKPDVSDNCPFWPNPAQNLPLWAVPPGDPDCDGFSTADEALIGTDPYKRCGANWPANINNAGNSANKVDIFDVNALAPPVFLSTAPGPPYTPRKDIARSPPSTNGRIDIFDVNKMAPPVFFATCVP